MANWQPGDLALCVNDRPADDGRKHPAKRGRIYTVATAFLRPEGVVLTFFEIDHPDAPGYRASRFRKVTPPKADEFDKEVISLMTSNPSKVEA